jgi:predicted transcriptional regulator YheO
VRKSKNQKAYETAKVLFTNEVEIQKLVRLKAAMQEAIEDLKIGMDCIEVDIMKLRSESRQVMGRYHKFKKEDKQDETVNNRQSDDAGFQEPGC